MIPNVAAVSAATSLIYNLYFRNNFNLASKSVKTVTKVRWNGLVLQFHLLSIFWHGISPPETMLQKSVSGSVFFVCLCAFLLDVVSLLQLIVIHQIVHASYWPDMYEFAKQQSAKMNFLTLPLISSAATERSPVMPQVAYTTAASDENLQTTS